jgi:uncharacterized protein YfbU (UPF0304 family)
MKLSRIERYFLSNQLRILEALYPDDAEDFAVQREAVEQGYELAYTIGMDHIHDDSETVSEEESKEVWDTMDMFLSIDRTIENLNLPELHKEHFTRFSGYDGNNESKYMAFASFTVERMQRFTHLPLEEDGYFNSHMPTRPIYLRMLKVWRGIPYDGRFPMNKERLLQVLEVAVHPDSR